MRFAAHGSAPAVFPACLKQLTMFPACPCRKCCTSGWELSGGCSTALSIHVDYLQPGHWWKGFCLKSILGAQICGKQFASVRVQALSMEQRSPELQERLARVGGSVGGTLPLRSVRARVPGVTRYTKQQFCRQLAHRPTPCTAGVSGTSVCQCPVGVHPPLDAVCVVCPRLICRSGILHTCPIQRTEAGPMVWTIFRVWATFTLGIPFCPKNLHREWKQSLQVSRTQLCCPACCLG
ncbi:uncharacterized protein LOC115338633 [Aquila chrysaetos chrysaetos]|uniref:uncharacterized protein LOC115338633 n=1 Tax=Aquila chrysaetos chrysaetos TaxID=223781 RepID=UPI001176846A|nr:uncharacterized protein LOC115338633 [Aquila chrysaetos chrysaetos]XP_029863173.1 uncharacterized protein LOC115338633 [Aquila chrysaetos chrysaetos]XP_029863174.1 uncharacterized protein LOC115338633 [Aquila chrysaetos chrysaetos]